MASEIWKKLYYKYADYQSRDICSNEYYSNTHIDEQWLYIEYWDLCLKLKHFVMF